MAISHVPVLRMLIRRHGLRKTVPVRWQSSETSDSAGDDSEISALKDFVDDAIVRGASLLLPDDSLAEKDCTDIHQRHFLKSEDLKRKELKQALAIYEKTSCIREFVSYYNRPSSGTSRTGVLPPPAVLYNRIASVKKLMAVGSEDLFTSFVILRRMKEETILKRLPLLKELGTKKPISCITTSHYNTATRCSLYQARKKNLVADGDFIKNLVNQSALPDTFAKKLIAKACAACGQDLNAMSADEIKIVILNEFVKMCFPAMRFNSVTDAEFRRRFLIHFKMKEAIDVVNIIREDKECVKNLDKIHFACLANYLSPEDLTRLLKELPTIGDAHVSSIFFHRRTIGVFVHGIDFFVNRYKFLRSEGFTDVEIAKWPSILMMSGTLLTERLEYWYNALGKNNVLLSNMGLRLMRDRKALYRYEVLNSKKTVPVHFVLRDRNLSCKGIDCVISGYIHEFCNKFSFDAKKFVEAINSSPHFQQKLFDLENFYNVYYYLMEQNVCPMQLENSPYILITRLEKVKAIFDKLAADGELQKWEKHPLLLDMVVHSCHLLLQDQQIKVQQEFPCQNSKTEMTSVAFESITSADRTHRTPGSGFSAHYPSGDDLILHEQESSLAAGSKECKGYVM